MIRHINRVSKPGRRVYSGARDLRPVLQGLGIRVISTSRGVISDREARQTKPGRRSAVRRSGNALTRTTKTMSRIGKKPVPVPAGVKVAIDGQQVTVEGKLGKLESRTPPGSRRGRTTTTAKSIVVTRQG